MFTSPSNTKPSRCENFILQFQLQIGLVFDGVVNTRQIQFLSHQSKIASKIELFVDCLSDADSASASADGGHMPDGGDVGTVETRAAADACTKKLYELSAGEEALRQRRRDNLAKVGEGEGGGAGGDEVAVKESVVSDDREIQSALEQVSKDIRTVQSELRFIYDNKVAFKRLGYLSLNSNERSQFQARELKSVYIDHRARFLRIKLHKCHVNKYNLVNQVGLIAVNVLGESVTPASQLLVGREALGDVLGNSKNTQGADHGGAGAGLSTYPTTQENSLTGAGMGSDLGGDSLLNSEPVLNAQPPGVLQQAGMQHAQPMQNQGNAAMGATMTSMASGVGGRPEDAGLD